MNSFNRFANTFQTASNYCAACNLLLMLLLLGQKCHFFLFRLTKQKLLETYTFLGFLFVLPPTLTFMPMFIGWKRVGFCNGTVGESESNIN